MVADLDSESDLDRTGVGLVLPATRKAPAAEAGAGTGGVAGGNPPAPSTPSRRAEIGSVNDSSSDSSNSKDDSTSRRGSNSNASHNSNGSSSTSRSVSSGDIPALTGTEVRRLQHFGKPPELQSGRARSRSRGWTLSESRTNAMLAYASTKAKEAEETERVHDLLLEERLEERREWLNELQDRFEGRGLRVKHREEDHDTDCPLARAAEHQSELSIPSPTGKKLSKVESPPHSVAGVERSVYRKDWEEAMQSEFDGHLKTETFHMVDQKADGQKPVSSKWCFDYKTDKERNITKFKASLVARGFAQIIRYEDYTHSSSPCPSASIKLVLSVANEKELSLRHFDVAQAYIRASLDEEVYMKLPEGGGEQSKRTAKLGKAVYGLKQSGRKWGHLCANTLIADGFEQQCKADPCIFRKTVDGVVVMIVGVYVDDLLIGGSEDDCDSLLASLNKTFPTKNLGE